MICYFDVFYLRQFEICDTFKVNKKQKTVSGTQNDERIF